MAEISDVKILFVDDEKNILSTLKRLMSMEQLSCEFCASGQEALKILTEHHFDIVVSDMRMPEMNGDELLTKVKEMLPHSIRFILSGYADFNSMMSALNNGGVHQFIAKPWDDEQLLAKLHEAANFILIRKEHETLSELTKQQAAALKDANRLLEARVEARTQELRQTADMLDLSFHEMKASYSTFIDVIGQVLQLRSIAPQDHLNDIAEVSRSLAKAVGETEQSQDDIYKAAKLHELGKIRIPDVILNKPLKQLKAAELKDYKQYPLQGFSLLASLDNLSEVSNLIKTHCERYDGLGFPAKLKGESIPMGSRIIHLVMTYFLYRNGLYDGASHSDEEAEKYIRSVAGKSVDPNLVEKFFTCVNEELAKKGRHEIRIQLFLAEAGMVLSRDLFNVRGVIMLTKGAVLTHKIIDKLKYIADKDSADYVLYVESKPIN